MGRLEQCIFIQIPYPLDCNPRVLFFKMSFWVGVNSKNPSISGLFDQKVGVYSRKTPKTGHFTLPGALFKSEWGCNQADTVGLLQSSILRYQYKIKFKTFFAFVVLDYIAWLYHLGLSKVGLKRPYFFDEWQIF